jgi:glycosyltransferase involved in cell wall biosynthesis
LQLHERASTLGVCVELRPWVKAAERESLMWRADLLVVPSLWPERFGIVGIEAAAVGLPAVAFDVGGIREWLKPGESGEICHGAASPRRLGEAIADVMGNPAHLQKLRLGGLEERWALHPQVPCYGAWGRIRDGVAAIARNVTTLASVELK